jgi:hypothetical protein
MCALVLSSLDTAADRENKTYVLNEENGWNRLDIL